MEGEAGVMYFEVGGRDCKPRNAGATGSWKRQSRFCPIASRECSPADALLLTSDLQK